MKILLTGGNGQLGYELLRALAPLGELLAPSRTACDLANAGALRSLVRAIRPDVIVNAAAYTAVDQAESDRAMAFAVNADAPAILGEEAARLGARVLHFSTDYVFDGEKETPYTECDRPAPVNVYGASKYQGELALAAACPRHLILRTSWVVGVHGSNFARTVLRLAREKASFGVVADQHGAPTSAALLADVTAHLLGQVDPEPCGIYHVTAAGNTTWHDYARFVLAEAAAAGTQLKAGPDDVLPLATGDYPALARRPRNSCLDTSLLHARFGLRMPPWQDGVRQVVRQMLGDPGHPSRVSVP